MPILATVRNTRVREKILRKRIYRKGITCISSTSLTAAVFARTKRLVIYIYKANSIERNRTYKRLCTVPKNLAYRLFPRIRYRTKLI